LAGDILFGALLLAYLTSATWSLTLFYYFREQVRAGTERASGRRPHTAPNAFGQAGRWSVVVAALALVLFLGTPRSGEARWELSVSGNRFFTGLDERRPEIDLNHSGTLKVNRDLVCEVRAFSPDGRPKTDLDPGLRWHGATFNYYDRGRWENRPRFDDNRRVFNRGSDPILPPLSQANLP